MGSKRSTRTQLEILALSITIGILEYFFAGEPGFGEILYSPYLISAFVIASYYGTGYGFASIGYSTLIIIGIQPLVSLMVNSATSVELSSLLSYAQGFWPSVRVPLPVAVGLTYLFGIIAKGHVADSEGRKERFRETSQENWRRGQQVKALQMVNIDLEERVSRQQDSMTSLYTQIRKMDTVDLNDALEVLLQTVQIFSNASRASIWQFDSTREALILASEVGWEDEEGTETSIPLDGTIEGWVYRNNSMFSVRMILEYENLEKMDSGNNLLTLPISISRKIWGILNIEVMPFEKYNLYTERILQIIVSLAEHSIERAVEYESLIQKEEMDSDTGLPLFSQFHRILDDELERSASVQGTISIIIFEISNYPDISTRHGQKSTKMLMKNLADMLRPQIENRGNFFHYKSDGQLALIQRNLDFDGTALFCLETLGMVNAETWKVDGEDESVELIVGYSATSGDADIDALLNQAENLLEMQKI